MRIHKELGGLNTALAVLLFLAACAWLGAGFWERLEEPQTLPVTLSHLRESSRLSGIAVREEELFCPEQDPAGLPAAGTRLAAGETLCRFPDGSMEILRAPAHFFPDWDGLEHLDPSRLFPFDAAVAAGLLQTEPEKHPSACGRLVFSSVWYYAARLEEGAIPDPQSRCRLLVDGLDRELEALVLAVAEDASGCYVLLRLDEGSADCLGLRRFDAELVLREYSGLSLPAHPSGPGRKKFH